MLQNKQILNNLTNNSISSSLSHSSLSDNSSTLTHSSSTSPKLQNKPIQTNQPTQNINQNELFQSNLDLMMAAAQHLESTDNTGNDDTKAYHFKKQQVQIACTHCKKA